MTGGPAVVVRKASAPVGSLTTMLYFGARRPLVHDSVSGWPAVTIGAVSSIFVPRTCSVSSRRGPVPIVTTRITAAAAASALPHTFHDESAEDHIGCRAVRRAA